MNKYRNLNNLVGGEFLIKNTRPSDVFSAEDWSEEDIMIKDALIEFIEKEVLPHIDEFDEGSKKKDVPLLLKKAGELGFFGTVIPEKYGGMEASFNTNILFGEAAAYGFFFGTTIGVQTSIGTLPIVYYGTNEQKEKYLPRIMTGEIKTCYCLTEPESGSDANSGKTRAFLNDDKSHYVLNGQKIWISNGGFADLFIVFAKIEDDKNLSAFIVEKGFGGITIGQEEKKMGIKGCSTVQLFFENCTVPVTNLLGKRNQGFKIALNILNAGRLKIAGSGIGGSKLALKKSAEYASQRKQFRKTIGEYGAIKKKLAEMAIKTFALESATYRVGHDIDKKFSQIIKNGTSKENSKLEAIKEFVVECSILKVVGSEVLDYVADESIQIHGGMGYATETGVERGYRDARITRIYEGTNEINRLLAFGELMKKAFKTDSLPLLPHMKAVPKRYLLQKFSFSSNSPEKTIKNLKQAFLLIAGKAGSSLKKTLIDEQEIVLNISNIMIEILIAESCFLRIEKLKKIKGYNKQKLKLQEKAALVRIYDAVDCVKKEGQDAINSFTLGFENKILHKMLSSFTKNININPKEYRRDIANNILEEKKFTL